MNLPLFINVTQKVQLSLICLGNTSLYFHKNAFQHTKILQMGIMMLITYLLQVNKIGSDISILSLYAVYYEYFVSS